MKVRQILYTVGGRERPAVMTIMIIYEMLIIPRWHADEWEGLGINTSVSLTVALLLC